MNQNKEEVKQAMHELLHSEGWAIVNAVIFERLKEDLLSRFIGLQPADAINGPTIAAKFRMLNTIQEKIRDLADKGEE